MTAPAPDGTEPTIVFPKSRRWPAALLGVIIGAGGATGVAGVLDDQGTTQAEPDAATVELATAPLETRDLIEEVEWTGDLTYGDVVDLAAPGAGTVTATSAVGSILERGAIPFEIDEQPVTILYGVVPAWRDLQADDEGPDVLQLETNLVALGYDPDRTVTVDDEFTAATEAMVERWQADIGLDESGVAAMGSIVVAPGPVSVVVAPTVGDVVRAGETVGQVSARSLVTDVVATTVGEVTSIVQPGTPVESGMTLFTVGGIETIAVFAEDDVPTDDDETQRAYVVIAPGRTTASVFIEVGDVLTEPGPALSIDAPTRSVVVPVELDSRDDWAVGDVVSVTLPDGAEAAAVVIDVGAVAQGGGQGQVPTVDVTIEVTESVDDDLPASEVTVTVAGSQVLGATVAPTRALVSLAEGGFAVEKVLDDGTTGLVGIETGAFDDGWVEIVSSTSSLAAGDQVVVPQ